MVSQFSKAKMIAERLTNGGAVRCQLVGGYVRDHLLGIESKDIDIEVYGLTYDEIISLLSPAFRVDLVGRSFGVVKVDQEIDISLPRRESKSGLGHTGFTVNPDSALSPSEAAARRDFTINALAMSFEGEIFDPYEGQTDLKNGVLRATTVAFQEDPLRVLRGMQFAARFGFSMDHETAIMCREMADEYKHLSRERIWEEWHKWAVKGRYPSQGLRVLAQTGWVTHFPVLERMRDTPQDTEWHPEGDVFAHTAYVCDAAADIAEREELEAEARTVLMFAALCHDFGKTTTTVKNADGRWVAPQHAEVSIGMSNKFLSGIGAPNWLIDQVLPLVAEHMAYTAHAKGQAPSERTLRRLAHRLGPATIQAWARVCEADASGRPPRPPNNPVSEWVRAAEGMAISDGRPQPLVLGRHLIPLGYQPGPAMGEKLRSAFEAQLDGEFDTLEAGIAWIKTGYAADEVPQD